ncbi:hypothetical protein MSG28_009429 [Choristoneura fumiferana]|uniref:Uncharacterized protein n=1 Tax=Choristoneura fumiferana TaxID=7141 RepID=A0ACC0KY02_CHOFU|nr:hypothetical protein MSG28_009429 [Choristoneura fumiferana]
MEKSARPRTALNECVKVVVRCRPLSARERSEGHDESIRVVGMPIVYTTVDPLLILIGVKTKKLHSVKAALAYRRPVHCSELSIGRDDDDGRKIHAVTVAKKRRPNRTDQKWYERLSTKAPAGNQFSESDMPLQVVRVCPERGAVQVLNPKGQDKLFTYDAVYDASADTQTIYDEMVRPLVASVLDGFNGCVFAYGQTGTGKTHTMEGSPDDEGIIPRAFRHIWAHIETSASRDVTHLVSCSYVELYLEDVRDLLSKDCKKLTIRGQELNGFYIPEMTSIVCKSAAEMARALRTGNRVRASGRTDMNEHSSRSHAVFLVTVESQHKDTNRIRVGKLNLVDLAGSERQRKTGAGGERLREAARINQALSSLGNVISALAENSPHVPYRSAALRTARTCLTGQLLLERPARALQVSCSSNGPHVPYRDSKLTRILQDSLGGNSKTIMIAAVGPASYNYDETITTLRYAHRAKAIKNKPIRNEDPKDAKLREYQAEIERLRALIQQRRAAERRPRRPPRAPAPRRPHPPPRPSRVTAEDTIDTESIENEHILAESFIEQEKSKTEELEQQIRSLEERLVSGGGGGDLLSDLRQSRAVLESRQHEIAERKKREVEMQQRIDLEEETTASVTHTFASLQQEVDHKTQRLKKCVSKYLCLREEMVELREAHDAERRDHEALQAALVGGLRRRLLLADSFVPLAGRALVARLAWDEDQDAWRRGHEALQAALVGGCGAACCSLTASCRWPAARSWRGSPGTRTRTPGCARPKTARGRWRGGAAGHVRGGGGGGPRRRAENLLDLLPMPLPPTTRAYVPPPPRHTRSMESSMKKEPSLEAPAPRKASARPRPGTAHHRLGTAGVR